MTVVVYKYPFSDPDRTTDRTRLDVYLPVGAKPVHFGFQRNVPTLWVILDPSAPKTERRVFLLAGTGHEIELADDVADGGLRHVGSALGFSDNLVLHCFEVEPLGKESSS